MDGYSCVTEAVRSVAMPVRTRVARRSPTRIAARGRWTAPPVSAHAVRPPVRPVPRARAYRGGSGDLGHGRRSALGQTKARTLDNKLMCVSLDVGQLV